MENDEQNELKNVASISAAGAGAIIASTAGIAFALPVAIGAGVCCLAYAGIKAFK